MNFGWPNAEIGRKMADGQLLFLALYYPYVQWCYKAIIMLQQFLYTNIITVWCVHKGIEALCSCHPLHNMLKVY